MIDTLKYYSITAFFYIIEIIIFNSLILIWANYVLLINFSIRIMIIFFFVITIRAKIFSQSERFYEKISFLLIINPLVSSFILSILLSLFVGQEILHLKIASDLFNSILFYILLKKII